MINLSTQIIWLFILALPIACVSWTVTHEEIFRDVADFCRNKSKTGKNLLTRKFFYLFTCEYCFSHYVTIAFLLITKYHLLLPNFWGYVIAGFALVWIANVYMSLFNLIRIDIKLDKTDIEIKEEELGK